MRLDEKALTAAWMRFLRIGITDRDKLAEVISIYLAAAPAPAPTVSGEPVACPKCDGTGRMQTELRGFEHCTRCDGSGTLAALRKARTALDGLYEGFLHNTEAGREAWDNADGFEVCSEIDALLAAAAAPTRAEVLEEQDMLEAGRKYEDNRKPDLIIRDEPFYSGAQLRAAYRHGYDFARALAGQKP